MGFIPVQLPGDDAFGGMCESYGKELEEAEEKAGKSEIVQAMGKTAEFWAKVVDKVRATVDDVRRGSP